MTGDDFDGDGLPGSKLGKVNKLYDDRGINLERYHERNKGDGFYVGPYSPDILRHAFNICQRWGVMERLEQDHKRKRYEKRLEIIVSTAEILEKLARPFFSAVKMGNEKKARSMLEAGVPINCTEPSTRFTALHYAAARRAHAIVEMLLARGGFDHLQRDGFGRLASELAGRFGDNPELAERLRMLEAGQAQERGIILTFRPRPPPTDE